MGTFEENLHPRRTDGRFAPKPAGASGEPDGLDLGGAVASAHARAALVDRAEAMSERAERLAEQARVAREAADRAAMVVALAYQAARRTRAVEVTVRPGEDPQVTTATDRHGAERRVAAFQADFYGRLNTDPGTRAWDRWSTRLPDDDTGAARWRIDLDAARADLAGEADHRSRYGELTREEAADVEAYISSDNFDPQVWTADEDDDGLAQLTAIRTVFGGNRCHGDPALDVAPIHWAGGDWDGDVVVSDSLTDPEHRHDVRFDFSQVDPPLGVSGPDRARSLARNIADYVRLYD